MTRKEELYEQMKPVARRLKLVDSMLDSQKTQLSDVTRTYLRAELKQLNKKYDSLARAIKKEN